MSANELSKHYNPESIEKKWYDYWENAGYFQPQGRGEPFCMMIPPPNITGRLHMGHAFEATIMDVLIRYQRMQQRNTLWQVGTDHAGIATQMLVERQLQTEQVCRYALGREAFVDKIWQWKQQSGGEITRQLRRMGASVDWSRERFTLDDGLSEAVKHVFVQLFDEGLIYRGKRLVNWDPVLQTAISDLEVVNEEMQGSLWHIQYPLVDQSGYIEVATTRPETLFGDTAVAVHPDDARFAHWIGQQVHLPLTQRTIPIIADEHVDPSFGSGCLKITPAHDFNDYEIGLRHDLPMITIFTQQAILNDNVPAPFRGLDRMAARQAVVEALEAESQLISTKAHQIMVPRGDRSGAVIEPYVTDQWYVSVKPLAKPAIQAVREGKIRFVPENWENTYYAWMENIEDWCISRQLWWGHRIPAWYDSDNNVYVGLSEQVVRKKYQLPHEMILKQDNDVLDTWFSSALWPFSTLGWPQKTHALKTFYPTQCLVTGFDIIFFWVARMIMFALKFTEQVPFNTVYIHGLIRDADGNKMSKSKGNVIDPLDLVDGISLDALIKKRTESLMQPKMAETIAKATRCMFPHGISAYGTDALRYTFCSLASTGRNIIFDFGRLEGYRNFCNKLWNAARFVKMHTDNQDNDYGDQALAYSQVDRWIMTQLHYTVDKVTKAFDNYRFDLAAAAAYDFVWHAYCDWYLELSKPLLQDATTPKAQMRGIRKTLVDVLETALRLIHPMMPYVTEEIWQTIVPLTDEQHPASIMLATYPVFCAQQCDDEASSIVTWLQSFIVVIRTLRSELNISPAMEVPIFYHCQTTSDSERIQNFSALICTVAKICELAPIDPAAQNMPHATGLLGNIEILLPMQGFIDVEKESHRLHKALAKAATEKQKSERKLANPNYLDKAPPNVVAMERTRLEELKQLIDKTKEKLTALSCLK